MLHYNGIYPFITFMGNFNWGPISCNDIVSNQSVAIQRILHGWLFHMKLMKRPFVEFHKFQMKQPPAEASLYHTTL